MNLIILIILILLIVGLFPAWPYNRGWGVPSNAPGVAPGGWGGWGYAPFGLIIIILILFLVFRPGPYW